MAFYLCEPTLSAVTGGADFDAYLFFYLVIHIIKVNLVRIVIICR